MFLVTVDAHSRWLDVHRVNSANTALTAEKLCTSFATHGVPEVLVSDKGPVFGSQEITRFIKWRGPNAEAMTMIAGRGC